MRYNGLNLAQVALACGGRFPTSCSVSWPFAVPSSFLDVGELRVPTQGWSCPSFRSPRPRGPPSSGGSKSESHPGRCLPPLADTWREAARSRQESESVGITFGELILALDGKGYIRPPSHFMCRVREEQHLRLPVCLWSDVDLVGLVDCASCSGPRRRRDFDCQITQPRTAPAMHQNMSHRR